MTQLPQIPLRHAHIDTHTLRRFQGIGEQTLKRIGEYLRTGTCRRFVEAKADRQAQVRYNASAQSWCAL